MNRKRNVINLVFTLVFFLFISSLIVEAQQQNEKITITTYYPAPYGIYRDLETRRLVIGEDEMPNVDGVVNFQGRDSNPSFTDDGALYYNASSHEFRYYDGGTASWRGLGGFSDFLVVQQRRSLGGGSGGVSAHCPSGYIRIACSGGMDFNPSQERFWDSGDEDSKGYNGAAPISNQGCIAFADGGRNIYVWAYCIKQ